MVTPLQYQSATNIKILVLFTNLASNKYGKNLLTHGERDFFHGS